MSDTIRALLREKQAGRPIDLNAAEAGMGQMFSKMARENAASPIPMDEGMMESLYESLLGPTMASQILDQYGNWRERTLQNALNQGDEGQLMRPMIRSVMQLDR
jgi:hypothetical protein